MSASPLRAALDAVIAEQGCSLKDLTVLAPKNDPFRLDTPARHRDGRWLAETAAELGLGHRKIHLRGLHYMVLGRTMPDGSQYVNDNDHWEWLQADAAKAARFLGYLPFDQITDQRNAEPVVRIRERDGVHAYLTTELDITIPDASELRPQLDVEGFEGVQPYRLALVGEKSSLADILGPLAERYDADLFLPTGEISDTQIYLMARAAADDGRPLAVFYFADCDPAGWRSRSRPKIRCRSGRKTPRSLTDHPARQRRRCSCAGCWNRISRTPSLRAAPGRHAWTSRRRRAAPLAKLNIANGFPAFITRTADAQAYRDRFAALIGPVTGPEHR